MSDVPMKRCTGPCGQEYPATTQFWHSDKTRPSGLHSQCKKCRADRKKNPPIMLPAVSEGYKRCTKCKKVYPTTTEYWYRTKKSKDGLQSNCKICTDAYYKEYQARPNVKEHRREQAKEYASRPEVKQHKREYGKGYHEQQSKRVYRKRKNSRKKEAGGRNRQRRASQGEAI